MSIGGTNRSDSWTSGWTRWITRGCGVISSGGSAGTCRWPRSRGPSSVSANSIRSSRSISMRATASGGDGAMSTRDADRHLSPILLGIVQGRPAGAVELDTLAAAMREDSVQSAFLPIDAVGSRHLVLERIDLVKSLWEPFAAWWRSYFSDDRGAPMTDRGADAPMTDLWRLYIPFAEWVVREKRSRRPDELFVIGFNGSPGAGKTVLTNAMAVVLNRLLGEAEGQAIARSGDDWYLGKGERELLRKHGYDPGLPGVSNRGLPGTHDLGWLRRNLLEMERSTQRSVIRTGNFDKKADDQPVGADRYFEVRGKVGVLLFDLWFAGAETDVDPLLLPDGLRRGVAENLRKWGLVFDRMDALWSF